MNVTWLLIQRDFVDRVRQRSFIVGTVIGVVLILGFAFLPSVFQVFAGATVVRLSVVAPDSAAAAAIAKSLSSKDYAITISGMHSIGPKLPPTLKQGLDASKYDAVLVAYRGAGRQLAFAYYPQKSTALENSGSIHQSLLPAVLLSQSQKNGSGSVAAALNFKFDVHSLNKRYKSDEEQAFSQGIAYVLLILLYVAVLVYGAYVGQGVIEEKSNRIMEIMIGAVRPSQLLAGKIFGVGAVALLQMTINAAAAALASILYVMLYVRAPIRAESMKSIAAASAQQTAMREALVHVPWSTLVFLIVFFLLGFFTFAAVYAGIGSLLTKPEEVQQYSFILTAPFIAAYVLAIFALMNPDLPVVVWVSMVPLLSPLLMFMRISTSDVPAWQIAVSIGGSMLAIWALTLLAGKLYRVGVLMYGKPPRPSEIWRALRAHT